MHENQLLTQVWFALLGYVRADEATNVEILSYQIREMVVRIVMLIFLAVFKSTCILPSVTRTLHCSIATVCRISLRFFFLLLSVRQTVDWPCQSAHYRHLPSSLPSDTAHLISLASFTSLPLPLLILARRDFGLFCGIAANSSVLLPPSSSVLRSGDSCDCSRTHHHVPT